MENILVASGAGTDEDLMAGNTLAVVTKNRKHEKISALQKDKPIYFSEQPNALGIIEAIEYYNFFAEKPVAK